MKRFLPLAALLLLAVCLFPHPARKVSAETSDPEDPPRYAVADGKDIWFYSSEDEKSGLFLLPYTYYVRVIAEGTLFTAVEYLDDAPPYRSVRGFCKTQDLTFVDFVPERPFLRREITVRYHVENPGGAQMGKGTFDTIEKTFVYYGESYSGTARFHYVYADGTFGYVPAAEEIVYELNTDYLQETSAEPAEPPAVSSGLNAAQIAVICVGVVVIVVIAVFVLRGKRASPVPQESEF